MMATGGPKSATVRAIAGRISAAFSVETLTACSTQSRQPSRHRNSAPRPLSLVAVDVQRIALRHGGAQGVDPGPVQGFEQA